MVKRIAIIPARGGSKRLPLKNILPFWQKPMIYWTIKAALESQQFDRVIVSTDSPKIAEAALAAGAEVPFLRSEFYNDQAPVSAATCHAMLEAELYWKEQYNVVVQLMACCPLRGAKEILEALKTFEQKQNAFQLSCVQIRGLQPWWLARKSPTGEGLFLFDKAIKENSPTNEPLYCPSGAIWIAQAEALKVSQNFYGSGWVFETIPYLAGLDIDTPEDFEFVHQFLPFKEKIHPWYKG